MYLFKKGWIFFFFKDTFFLNILFFKDTFFYKYTVFKDTFFLKKIFHGIKKTP